MKITPLDLRKPDFKRAFKGYDVDEVRELLSAAADSLEESLRENLDLKNRLTELNERLKNYTNMEGTLNETLILAQKAGESARQAAQRESELIVAKAEVEAERLLDATKSRLRELKYELEGLEEEKQAFLVKMRSLVASQWKLLQEESNEAAAAAAVERARSVGKAAAPSQVEDFSEGYFEQEGQEEDDEPAEPRPPAVPSAQPAAQAKTPLEEPQDQLERQSFGAALEDALEPAAAEDSVTNLSRRLGEFLRARGSGGAEAGPEAAAEEDSEEAEAPLSWGAAEEPEGKPDVFWGQSDEAPEEKGKKGGRRK